MPMVDEKKNAKAETQDAQERARKIKMLLFDVDGVLTDGTIWVVPAGSNRVAETGSSDPQRQGNRSGSGDGGFGLQSQTMAEAKGFAAHDGIGISLARVAGLEIGFVTKRISEALKVRARDLKIKYLYTGQAHKMDAVRDLMQKTGLTLDQIAFVGDDIVDLAVMRVCGLAIAVPNARQQVLDAAHYVTPLAGGHGAGRDAIEFILRARGVLEETIEKYLDASSTAAAESDIGVGNM